MLETILSKLEPKMGFDLNFDQVMDEAEMGFEGSLNQIAVLGLGGCGGGAVANLANYALEKGLKGLRLIAANSDAEALDACAAPRKIALGPKRVLGFGCGGDPALGAEAAEESMDSVLEELSGAKLVFILAGLGGGTGTGASMAIAKALSSVSNPPVIAGLFLLPFGHEGQRIERAKEAMASLERYCQSVFPVYNDRLLQRFPKPVLGDCLRTADDVLLRAVSSVTDLIGRPGGVNVALKDISKVLGRRGQAALGLGEAAGPDRAVKALKMALRGPFMSGVSLAKAKAALVSVTTDSGALMGETAFISQAVKNSLGGGCEAVWGMSVDSSLKGTGLMKVAVMATGLPFDQSFKEPGPKAA
ncbi:MAG: hypothetical protein LBE49_02910 [Deltaproteobacteria bacterium]|jgi:cell division protein FtsZ|nr:hypothetical protein [Deltaproteobacteria bacterium]